MEVGRPCPGARAPGRPLASATKVEVPVVQQPAPEQLAGAPARTEPGCRDAVKQLADRFPFLCRYAGIQDRVFRPESRLAPSSLHGSPLAGDASIYACGARQTVRQVPPGR